jgi:hypothetical protein
MCLCTSQSRPRTDVSVRLTPPTVRRGHVGVKDALVPGFTRVKNLARDKVGVVQDILSVQFTIYYDDDSMDFLFTNERGQEWEVVL